MRAAEKIFAEMSAWEEALPRAALDEVAGNLVHRHRQLMAGTLAAPALTATAGVGEITLSWAAVTNAASYELWA